MRTSFVRLLLAIVLVASTGATLHAQQSSPPGDGSHDFDWELGDWTVRIERLTNPLSDAEDAWATYEGTSVLRPLWGGKGNIGELNVSGPAGTIQGLSLRTYNPQTGQWQIHWANASDGVVGPPMVGGFGEDGVGLFYNQETFRGRPVFVRFIFADITPTRWRLEQAYSADGGATWETNWIARFERVE